MVPTVFLSYAREDRRWVERLRERLGCLIADPDVAVWDDTYIGYGADWDDAIYSAMVRARVAVLMSTYTYIAYGNESGHNPFREGSTGFDTSELVWSGFRPVYERDVIVHGHPAPWGLSSYDLHADGEGAAFVTWRRPLLTLRPGVMPAWNFPADMQLLHFLDSQGIGYDVITDHDVQSLERLLDLTCVRPWRCARITTHRT